MAEAEPEREPLARADRGLPDRAARRGPARGISKPACGTTRRPGGSSSATPGCTPTSTSNSAPARPASGSSTPSTATPHHPPRTPRLPPARLLPPPRPPCAAVAAGLLVAVALGWCALEPRPTAEVAWLVNAQNCTWAGGEAAGRPAARQGARDRPRAGRVPLPVRRPRDRSKARPSWNWSPAPTARLHRGRLTARVPPGAAGFEVLSPQGKVIDLGTEFGVVGLGERGDRRSASSRAASRSRLPDRHRRPR